MVFFFANLAFLTLIITLGLFLSSICQAVVEHFNMPAFVRIVVPVIGYVVPLALINTLIR